jgi:hypothetical protein
MLTLLRLESCIVNIQIGEIRVNIRVIRVKTSQILTQLKILFHFMHLTTRQ